MILKRMQFVQILIDGILLVLGMIPFILLFVLGTPTERGFFCGDQDLMYPYRDSTITTPVLLTTWSLGGFALIFTVEFLQWGRPCRTRWKEGLWRSLKVSSAYTVSVMVTAVLTEIPKNAVGRLRPHFFYVCVPDFNNINCSDGYITEFTCLNTRGFSEGAVADAKKSFVSGHATVSVFCAFFIGVYVEQRMSHLSWTILTKTMIQTGCATYALITCISRVNDYKHHPSDVAAGVVIGLLCGLWMLLSLGKHIGLYGSYMEEWYKDKELLDEDPSMETGSKRDSLTLKGSNSPPFRLTEETELRERSGSSEAT